MVTKASDVSVVVREYQRGVVIAGGGHLLVRKTAGGWMVTMEAPNHKNMSAEEARNLLQQIAYKLMSAASQI